jgi:hypothetical protein
LDAGQLSARIFRDCRRPKTSTTGDMPDWAILLSTWFLWRMLMTAMGLGGIVKGASRHHRRKRR